MQPVHVEICLSLSLIDYRQSSHNVIQPPVLLCTTLHFFYYLVLMGSFIIASYTTVTCFFSSPWVYYIYFVYRNIGNRNTLGTPSSNDWIWRLVRAPQVKAWKISNDSILSTFKVENQHLRIYHSCSLSAVFRMFNVLYLYITCVLHTLFHWNGVVEVSTRELRKFKLAGETATIGGLLHRSTISQPLGHY